MMFTALGLLLELAMRNLLNASMENIRINGPLHTQAEANWNIGKTLLCHQSVKPLARSLQCATAIYMVTTRAGLRAQNVLNCQRLLCRQPAVAQTHQVLLVHIQTALDHLKHVSH